jgi:hypothetical protein
MKVVDDELWIQARWKVLIREKEINDLVRKRESG